MTERTLRSAAMMIIADSGLRRERAFEDEMARLFPGEPTRFSRGDYERAKQGDDAAMLRYFRIGLSAERAELEKMSESRLAGQLLATRLAADSVNLMFSIVRQKRLAEDAVKGLTKKANDARHAEDREIAERIKAWYAENRHFFNSMDAAATAAMRIEPVTFRTARKHIGAAAKNLHSARKA